MDDFNAYFKDRDYQAELLVPLHSQEQDVVFVVGRSPSAEAFGKAYEHYESERKKDGSTVSELDARFEKCTTLTSRDSFVTVK